MKYKEEIYNYEHKIKKDHKALKLKLKESNKEYAKVLKKCAQLEMLCKHKKIKLNKVYRRKKRFFHKWRDLFLHRVFTT